LDEETGNIQCVNPLSKAREGKLAFLTNEICGDADPAPCRANHVPQLPMTTSKMDEALAIIKGAGCMSPHCTAVAKDHPYECSCDWAKFKASNFLVEAAEEFSLWIGNEF
jgi:hypothetical protein